MTSIPDFIQSGSSGSTTGGGGGGVTNIFNQVAAPSTPKLNALWWNPTAKEWKQWDGSVWVLTGGGAYLPLAGTTPGGEMADTSIVQFLVPTGAAPPSPVTRIDGIDATKSAISNFTIDGGRY